MASKRFQRSGETMRNRNSKEEKEKEGFYAFHKAKKQQRSGNFLFPHIRPF